MFYSGKMSCIYLLQEGDTNHYKIGRTMQPPAKRKDALQTGNPSVLTLVRSWGVSNTPVRLEWYLHNHFAENRLWGSPAAEFFKFDTIDDVIDVIGRIVDEHNDELLDETIKAGDDLPLDVDADSDEFQTYCDRQMITSQISTLTYRRERLDRRLKRSMNGRCGMRLKGAGTSDLIRWTRRTTRRFDSLRLKKENEALYNEYIKETTSTYYSPVG